jgi:hypothetical protein
VVERANRYLETSFLPGRRFDSPSDFNEQLAQWLPIANSRKVRRIDGRPIDLVGPDTAAMLALPPIAPTVEMVTAVRLGRDYYVRVAGNDYSVDPAAIGQLVDVHAGLSAITVARQGYPLATHERVWAKGKTITMPAHVEAAARLRHQFQQPAPAAEGHPVRDLSDYDRAFGVDFDSTPTGFDGEVA